MMTPDVLFPIAAKGALVLLLAGLVSLLPLNRSAAFRHLAWAGGLFALLLLPLLSIVLPQLPVPGLSSVMQGVQREIPPLRGAQGRDDIGPVRGAQGRDDVARYDIARDDIAPAMTNTPSEGVIPSAARDPSAQAERSLAPLGMTMVPMIPLLWLTGTMLLLTWLLVGHQRARAIARRCQPTLSPEWSALIAAAAERAGVSETIEVRESGTLTVPITVGLFRPVVVVPVDGTEWLVEHRLDVLVHEFAHIRRRDCLTHTIGWVACAVHWFNPLAWLALYRARVEREHACDDVVLAAGARPSSYAQELLATAQVARIPLAAGAASLAMARRSQLTGRLLAILDANRRRAPLSRRGAGLLGAAGVLLVLPVAAIAPAAAPPEPGPVPPLTEPTMAAPSTARIVASPDDVALIAAAAARPLVLSLEQQAQSICPRTNDAKARTVKLSGSMSITGQGNAEDGNGNSWLVWSGIDCSVKILRVGTVSFNDDETDVATMSRSSRFEITHSEGRDERVYTVTLRDGRLERVYTVNGRATEMGADAVRWRSALVLAYIRRTAYQAEARTRRIYAASGVDGVLAEIEHIDSDWAAGQYFGAVLAAKLDGSATTKVVTAAGRRLESDYELGKVLRAVPVPALAGASTRAAYVQATESIESDYELGRTLARALSAGPQSPEVTRALLERAKTMESDHELAQLLLGLVATGTIRGDAGLVYLDAVPTMESDYEKQRVLTAIAPVFANEPRLLAQSLRTAATIDSDHSLSEYLKVVLSVTPLAGDLVVPFFVAVATIESDYNLQEVLVAALGRSSGPEVVTQVLNATRRIESDHSQAEVLLAAIHRGLTADQQALLRRVAEGIESDYDRDRVLKGLR